ncbi:AzlC family ABC transporter permease [Pediococcus inopinatus]|uniref:AzlC family ABC transporter permease n=1 Tax=Pediococcus inopinatus TaxID=114090 RepID=A0ABZ0Q4F9_9LACO|nr:AzlC family ABC transporter permease [Pediococcus inopinatus]AVL00975.1 branched-chain amino acid transporter AzlC [Pediococcus inopinatus]KRN60625.1 amino acid transport protein [Pediococcus inopinatus]WPC16714.1 AzlC family ABC transporter permease [Pediococcus inopinatus]WPC20160.1 AzlC family ABC transporter permease [Pediococcus inopinatus]WPC21866.1 AzlC family ABC transporter permease [Pediococcus inopinatus]
MNEQLDFETGVREAIPTVLGYIGIGLAFGVVGKTSGLSVLEIFLMSLITYAGSAQFIMVSLMLVGSSIPFIMLSVFLVNARFILMSTTVAQYFRKDSLGQNIGIGSLLTDESFALSMNKLNFTDHHLKPGWIHGANIVAYLTWAFATAAGGLLGNLVGDPKAFGLDFALVAMFIGLLYLQMITDKSKAFVFQIFMVVVVCFLMYGLTIFFSNNVALIVTTLVGCFLGMVIEQWRSR